MRTPRSMRVVVVGLAFCALGACACEEPGVGLEESGKIPITTSSDGARSSYLEGRRLAEALRFTDARRFYADAAQADPHFALAHLGLANTSTTNTEFFEALEQAKANKGSASEGERMLIQALAAAVDREPGVQRTQLEALVAAYPEDERAHNTLAIFFFGQQEYEPAIAGYRAAIKIDPDFSPPYNQLGYALRRTGDFAGAEEAFRRYTELIPDQPNPYDSYAELLMKMGRYEESIGKYNKALEIDPNFVASYVGIANNLMFMGRTDEARETMTALEQVARNDAERRQACTWSAVSHLYDIDFDRAVAEVQRQYDIAAETDDRGTMSGDLNLMGNILLMAGRTEQALETYLASVEMAESADIPEEVKEANRRNHLFNVARTALWREDVEDATATAARYSEAVAVHNVLFEVQQAHELNALIAISNGDYNAALSELGQANLQNPRVLLLQGKALKELGALDAARAVLTSVVDFNQFNVNLAYERPRAQAMLEKL